MGSLERKYKRSIDKLSRELLKKLSKPDSECNNCTKEDVGEDCYLTCPELFNRNKILHKDLIDKVRFITGDERLI